MTAIQSTPGRNVASRNDTNLYAAILQQNTPSGSDIKKFNTWLDSPAAQQTINTMYSSQGIQKDTVSSKDQNILAKLTFLKTKGSETDKDAAGILGQDLLKAIKTNKGLDGARQEANTFLGNTTLGSE